MSKISGVACISEQATYKPGDPAPEGYLAWHEWAEAQHKAGLRQKQCGKCSLWRYPQELSDEWIKWEGVTSRGRKVKRMAPVCLKCAPKAAQEHQPSKCGLTECRGKPMCERCQALNANGAKP